MAEDVTLKQEIFCQAWVDTVGNGTQSALIAFDIEGKELLEQEEPVEPNDKELKLVWKEELKQLRLKKKRILGVAASMATEYLRKPDVIKRIDEILEERGFVDSIVKQEHFKLIKGADENTKMRAIDSYYKLKGKITDKIDHTTNGEKIAGFNYILPNGNTEDNNANDKAIT